MVVHTDSVPSLYVHVPFCAQKCEYCAFYSHAPRGELVNRFVESLILEMRQHAGMGTPRTVFFGGGTPSLLNLKQWRRLLEAMEEIGLLGAPEWTVECNPATVSLDKARLLRSFGVNRISMGVQSLDETLLERLGRVHSRDMVFRSFDTLREAGFDNVNLDLMFAIPGQSLDVWKITLAEAFALQSEHLSSYEVIYEEDTPLYAQLQAGEVAEDEDLACAMYEELVAGAVGAGFEQYEVANFARGGASVGGDREWPGRACLHNINYWRGGTFVGVGPSACGFLNGERIQNHSNTQLYCDALEAGRPVMRTLDRLSPVARAGEIAAFGLRMNAGWPFAEFQRATGFDLQAGWGDDMARLVAEGMGVLNGTGFRLTDHGLRFADRAAGEFLRTDEVSVRSGQVPVEGKTKGT
jgi:oxygen-independent coproporphyrinogen III oxidase